MSFIDLRDLDVFPSKFFDAFNRMAFIPQIFENAQQEFKFEAVALYRPQFANLHAYLYQSPEWQLVFADPVAVLFLKTSLSDSLSITTIQGNNFDFSIPKIKQSSWASKTVNAVVNPFFINTPVEYNNALQASIYLKSIGEYQLSLNKAVEAIALNTEQEKAYLQLGDLYTFLIRKEPDPQYRTTYYENAFKAFKKAKEINPKSLNATLSLGNLYFVVGNYSLATSTFKNVLEIEANNTQALTKLADCQNGLMQQDPSNQALYGKRWFEYMNKAYKANTQDALIRYRLGISYCQRGDCKSAAPLIDGLQRLPQLNDAQFKELRECQNRCL